MHWIALRLPPEPPHSAEGRPSSAEEGLTPGATGASGASGGPAAAADGGGDALADDITALGWWALQFTPKVALLEGSEAEGEREKESEGEGGCKSLLVLEVSASERLFGGRQQLLAQIFQSNKQFAQVLYAQAATSLIAIAKLQIKPSEFLGSSAASELTASLVTGASAPVRRKPGNPRDNQRDSLLNNLPDNLPLTTLAAARAHLPTLARIGCTTWGQLRALPRGGVVRRFGAALLDALDRAYGDKPELYPWLTLPEVLQITLELQAQVETAPALMFSARRLLANAAVAANAPVRCAGL